MEEIILNALPEDSGKRLDLYISQNTDYSRNSVQILLDNGDISVNDKAVTKSYKIKNGDVVVITVHPPKETEIVAENIPLDISATFCLCIICQWIFGLLPPFGGIILLILVNNTAMNMGVQNFS